MVLKELTALRGVSGDEGAVREYILEKARALADEVTVDRMGNVLAFKKARVASEGETRHVMLDAHMDEVGLIINSINDDGLLSYETVGGVDPRVVISKRVTVGKNAVPGVIGAKAIHLQSAEERGRALAHRDLYIDIGAKDKASAEALVELGDYVCFVGEWLDFGAGLVKSRALDDRVGCACMLAVLEGEYPCDVTCAFTVMEEIGLRGAKAAGFGVASDCAIALEGTTANDMGDVPEHLRVCRVGGGVAVSFMDHASISHNALARRLRELGDAGGISWQLKKFTSGGNDAGALQSARAGRPTAVLSVPCRYIHSPSSVASLADIDAQYKLVDAFLAAGGAF